MKKEQEWIELRQILIRKLNFLQLIFIGKNDQSIRKIAKQLTVNDFKDNFHKSVLSLISIITKDFKIDNKYNEKEIDSNYIDGECFFFDIVLKIIQYYKIDERIFELCKEKDEIDKTTVVLLKKWKLEQFEFECEEIEYKTIESYKEFVKEDKTICMLELNPFFPIKIKKNMIELMEKIRAQK